MTGDQTDKTARQVEQILAEQQRQGRLLHGDPYDRKDGGLLANVRSLDQAMWGTEDDRDAGIVQTMRRVEARTWMILVGVVLGPAAGVLLSGLVR